MLIQEVDPGCSRLLSPPGTHAPMWDELVKEWSMIFTPVHSSVELGPEVISVGRDDCEPDDCIADESTGAESHDFGWDKNPCWQVDLRPKSITGFWWVVPIK